MARHPRARAACPSCLVRYDRARIDPDLKVCPPCREHLRWEMSEWLKQLVGMGVLGATPAPRAGRSRDAHT